MNLFQLLKHAKWSLAAGMDIDRVRVKARKPALRDGVKNEEADLDQRIGSRLGGQLKAKAKVKVRNPV